MDKILVLSNMFDKDQSIVVYKDNKLITTVSVPLEDMTNTVKGLLSQYELSTVELVGNEEFLTKYKNDFNNEFNNIHVYITATTIRR